MNVRLAQEPHGSGGHGVGDLGQGGDVTDGHPSLVAFPDRLGRQIGQGERDRVVRIVHVGIDGLVVFLRQLEDPIHLGSGIRRPQGGVDVSSDDVHPHRQRSIDVPLASDLESAGGPKPPVLGKGDGLEAQQA
jgi:hypothetical protein